LKEELATLVEIIQARAVAQVCSGGLRSYHFVALRVQKQ